MMSELSRRIEVIEAGYEYLLAYAAQGRQDDAGTPVRETLSGMRDALTGLGELVRAAVAESSPDAVTAAAKFIDAVDRDAAVAAAAIALVLDRAAISSLLIDNLN